MSEIFPPNSRYYGVPLRTRLAADGSDETFVGRRIIPAMDRYRALDRYRTSDDSRIDNVAAAAFGDPERTGASATPTATRSRPTRPSRKGVCSSFHPAGDCRRWQP